MPSRPHTSAHAGSIPAPGTVCLIHLRVKADCAAYRCDVRLCSGLSAKPQSKLALTQGLPPGLGRQARAADRWHAGMR